MRKHGNRFLDIFLIVLGVVSSIVDLLIKISWPLNSVAY